MKTVGGELKRACGELVRIGGELERTVGLNGMKRMEGVEGDGRGVGKDGWSWIG